MSFPGQATRLIALLGDPVAHSLSPRFQNAAFRAAGLDAVYLALRSSSDALPGLLRGIAQSGGAGNVTVPHKQLAASSLDVRTDAVDRTRACNTFWMEDGRVIGDNTDVVGFRAATALLLGEEPRGARVLLLGAGGAARAAAVALAEGGAAGVDVVNRTRTTAERLVREIVRGEPTIFSVSELRDLDLLTYDLVVNATSVGLTGDAVPLSPERISQDSAVLDLVYRPGGTAWVRALRKRGINAADGTEMLLQQGAAAFDRWWGLPAPLDAMRTALSG